MKKCLLILVVLALVAAPAWAAKVTYSDITHPVGLVLQAYPGDSNGNNKAFKGAALGADVITAVPGVLQIVPGDLDKNGDGVIDAKTERWPNFISAPSYSIKSIQLTKTEAEPAQCNWFYDGGHVLQRGTVEIRLWWPLMYEAPGTSWELTIFYTVPGQLVVYKEIWTWEVDATIDSVMSAIDLFRELPFGLCEVPLIQDEALYPVLKDILSQLKVAVAAQDWEEAANQLMIFEFTVTEACVTSCPPSPMPTGPQGTLGIVNTRENPACCKLLVDAEFLGSKYGIWAVAK